MLIYSLPHLMRSAALSLLRRPAALSAGAPDVAGESGGGAKGATPCPAPLRPACHHFAALFYQIIPASFLICCQTVVYSFVSMSYSDISRVV